MNLAIRALAAAAFAMITTEFNIIGVLPLIARDLSVPVSQVGLLVTAFAFTVALVGPFLTIGMAHVERRRLFVGILAVSAVGNLIAAAAPNFTVLAIGRVICALALPVFWSAASSTAARIAGPAKAGRAIATVFSGISIASVLGVPLTTLLAGLLNWRAAFSAAAAVCGAMGLLIWLVFPANLRVNTGNSESPLDVLRKPSFIVHLLVSLLVMAAMFTAYTYLADTLARIGHFSNTSIGWILMGFGVAGALGNAIAGRYLDHGPVKASIVSIVVVGLAMGVSVKAMVNPLSVVLALSLWGAAHAGSFVANHVRVIKAAPEGREDFAASLNVSVFNTGIGLGAVIGGKVIDLAGLQFVGLAGAVLSVCAVSLLLVAQRRSTAVVEASMLKEHA